MTVWLSDIKMGYCTTGWWLSQKFCCLEVSEEGEGCAEWRNWGGIEPFRYFFYIVFAVCLCDSQRPTSLSLMMQGLFSFTAAFLVRGFAPYAAGSGISEIKCILGGFIIKGFLDVETFFIKGLTLVRYDEYTGVTGNAHKLAISHWVWAFSRKGRSIGSCRL